MNISSFLKKNIIKRNISQTKTVSLLMEYHEEFRYLDEITLSRWVNNRVQPSKIKIILLIIYFSENVLNDLKKIDIKKVSTNNFIKAYESKKKLLSNSYHSYNLHKVDSYHHEILEHEQFVEKLSIKHVQSVNIYNDVKGKYNSSHIDNHYISAIDNDDIISFFPFVDIKKNNDEKETKNSIYILPEYMASIIDFEKIFYIFLNFILGKEKDEIVSTNVYFLVRDEISQCFFEVNGFVLNSIKYIDSVRYFEMIISCEKMLSSPYCLLNIKNNLSI
ncbi:TPA: hypothetical protein ACX6QU_001338 [Photobacterium damselae]